MNEKQEVNFRKDAKLMYKKMAATINLDAIREAERMRITG